jgi:hypothetical protein
LVGAAFAAKASRPSGLIAAMFVPGLMLLILGPLLTLWRLTVVPVPRWGEHGTWSSTGGAGHFPVAPPSKPRVD